MSKDAEVKVRFIKSFELYNNYTGRRDDLGMTHFSISFGKPGKDDDGMTSSGDALRRESRADVELES